MGWGQGPPAADSKALDMEAIQQQRKETARVVREQELKAKRRAERRTAEPNTKARGLIQGDILTLMLPNLDLSEELAKQLGAQQQGHLWAVQVKVDIELPQKNPFAKLLPAKVPGTEPTEVTAQDLEAWERWAASEIASTHSS